MFLTRFVVALSALAFGNAAFVPKMPRITARAPVAASRAIVSPVMITGLEGPALVSCAHVILAMNFMPLGPTAYGLGAGGKVMSPGQCKWGDRAFGNLMVACRGPESLMQTLVSSRPPPASSPLKVLESLSGALFSSVLCAPKDLCSSPWEERSTFLSSTWLSVRSLRVPPEPH